MIIPFLVAALTFNAYTDIESAYICRGYVWDSKPFNAQYADIGFDAGAFGHLEGYVWAMNALTSRGHSTSMRNAYNEVDYGLRYTYNIKFNDDFTLANTFIRQWVTNPGVRHGGHSAIDWQFLQTLKNPYITPYWRIRYFRRPFTGTYYCAGLKRSFELTERLSLTLDAFADFGNRSHFRHLFGTNPEHPGRDYHAGAHAVNFVARIDYALTEYFGVYAFAGAFSLVDNDARRTVKAQDLEESKRDLFYGGAGVKVQF